MRKSKLRIGEILIKENIIDNSKLQEALSIQKKEGGRIGEILVRLGFVDERDLVITLGKQLGIPYIFMTSGLLVPAKGQGLEQIIPEEIARQYQVLPLSKNLNSLTVALVDPLELITIDNLKKMTGCEINPIATTKSDLIKAIDDFYGKRDMLKEVIDESYGTESVEMSHIVDQETDNLSLDKLVAEAEEAPVIK